jgi:carboxyl-terminal processing protease
MRLTLNGKAPDNMRQYSDDMRRLIAITLLALSLLSSSWTASQAVDESASEALSAKDRIEILETVWKTINDEYYDPAFNGVNWSEVRERYRPRVEAAKSDDEFYTIIKQMLLELHDLHTGFVAPGEQSRSSGISVYEVEDKAVVVNVVSDSDAARAGVQAGMIVSTLDGKPVEARLAELRTKLGHWTNGRAYRFAIYGALLGGPANTTLRLGLERTDGTQFEVVLTHRAVASSPAKLTAIRLPSGFGYMKINRALLSPVDNQFESEFKTLKDAPGLIIDLRGISGGDIKDVGVKIANYFFPAKVSFGKFINRAGETPLFRSLSAGGDKQAYQGPVVILIDEATRSAGEVFASGFQENGRADIVGLQSCGCVLDRDSKKVKGGGVLQYSHLGYISGKGRKLEGTGVVPDRIVPLTISALRQGRDPILEGAERSLRSKTSH